MFKFKKIIKLLLLLSLLGESKSLNASFRRKLARRQADVETAWHENKLGSMGKKRLYGIPIPLTETNIVEYLDRLEEKVEKEQFIDYKTETERLMQILSPIFEESKEDDSNINVRPENANRKEQLIKTSMEDDPRTAFKAINLIRKFVKTGKSYIEAADIASYCYLSPNPGIQWWSSRLFCELFNQKQGFVKAFITAEFGMQIKKLKFQERAINLFDNLTRKLTILVKKASFLCSEDSKEEDKQIFTLAIRATKISRISANRIRSYTDLLKAVVEELTYLVYLNKTQFFAEAIKVAKRSMYTPIQANGFNLFIELVKKGQGFKQAINAAAEIDLRHELDSTVIETLYLFIELVKRGHGFMQAINAAEIGMQRENGDVKAHALKLVKLWLKNVLDKGDTIQEELIDILENLSKNELILKPIIFFLNNLVSSERLNLNKNLKDKAIDLLEKLTSCSYCYDKDPVMFNCPNGHPSCIHCVAESITRLLRENRLPNSICASECYVDNKEFDEVIEKLINQGVLSDKDFAKLFILREVYYLKKKNPNKFFECPFCLGGAIVKNPAKNKTMECIACMQKSCIDCKKAAHDGSCLEAKFNETSNVDDFFAKAMDEFLIRRCATCNQVFVKTEACNVVGCNKCNHYTCYHCGANIGSNHNAAYRHFGESMGLCPLYAPGKNDQDRNEYYYNKAKWKALSIIAQWIEYRFNNELPIDGFDSTKDPLGQFIEVQKRRLDEENQFND